MSSSLPLGAHQTTHEWLKRSRPCVELLRTLDEADNHIGRVYDRNFEMWAQVFRQTRIEIALQRIEDYNGYTKSDTRNGD